MKAIVDPIMLIKELKKMAPVVLKNTILPIIQCVKMDFVGRELTMTATDLNTVIIIKTECESKGEHSFVIPYSDICDVCSRASGPLHINVDDKNISLKYENSCFKIQKPGDAKDFPKTTEYDVLNTVAVDGDFFFSLSGANECKHKDAQFSVISNVGVDFSKENITVVGTNGALMYKKVFHIPCDKKTVASVPSEFIIITKLFQECELKVSNKNISATYGNTTVSSLLSEVPFVDYRHILPKDVIYNIRIDKESLCHAINNVSIAASKKTGMLKISSSTPRKVLFEANDIENNKEGLTEISVEANDVFPTISILGAGLLNVLKTINAGYVKISISNEKYPIYIQPEDDEDVLLFVAPIVTI